MELKLYDTLTREKRLFKPIDPARVRMYVCGPTVYDYAHIGNARPVIVFDVLFRLLRHLYGEQHVTYVRNITDVDDKINARAAEEYPNLPLNEAIREVTNKTDKQFHEDVAALGCLPPTVEPRATEHIEEMKALIERLVKSGNAYVAEEHVLFSVPSMPDYGKLSNRPLDEMIAGARVDVAAYKKNEMDFVLWKPSKPGEPAWPSPAGIKTPGRPGWHIECSAMSWKHLGETFDIHGGGIDLVFPHHENEIAQSRCAFHTPVMANYWMHNGFLEVEGEKMSKSLGNFLTVCHLREKWSGPEIRLTMLKSHYRQPIDWTEKGLLESKLELENWRKAYGAVNGETFVKWLLSQPKDFFDALSDDLNTPQAITVIHGYAKHAQKNDIDRANLLYCLTFLNIDRVVADFIAEYAKPFSELGSSLAEQFKTAQQAVALVAHNVSNLFNSAAYLEVVKNAAEFRKQYENIVQSYGSSIGQIKKQFEAIALNPNIRKLLASAKEASELIEKFGGTEALSETMKYYNQDREFTWSNAQMAKDLDINNMIETRISAKKGKNFKEADRIRDELAAMGVVLKNSKDGTTWEIAR